ncbi:MAG: lipocalin family protein [Roseiarcus sp.]|jgi:lipocalin
MWRIFLLTALVPTLALAAPVRDLTAPMIAVAQYDKARLVGHWFEVAQTPSILEQDCHGVTVDVATRDDSRSTLKIACHKSSLDGPLLPIEGVLAETDPGIYQLRLVHLLELGNLQMVVLWQSDDDGMAAIGAPLAEIGWVWSKTAHPDPRLIETARQSLISAGYRPTAIRPVEQAP